MKYYKVIIFGLILYSSFMLIQVFTVEGYNGLKFLSFYMFVAAWFVAWWMGWLYPQADGSDIKKGEFKHEVRQFEKSYDNQQAEQISLMV